MEPVVERESTGPAAWRPAEEPRLAIPRLGQGSGLLGHHDHAGVDPQAGAGARPARVAIRAMANSYPWVPHPTMTPLAMSDR